MDLEGKVLSDFCATVAPVITCIVAGSLIGRRRGRWPGADMLVGFGLLGSFLTLSLVLLRIPISWALVIFTVLSSAGLTLRRQAPGGYGTWLALILVTPLFYLAVTSEPALWDEFWHWLPSAAYVYTYHSLPWPELPASFSKFPGYPQFMPFTIATASLLAGRFLEAAGPVINIAMLAASSALLADALTAAIVRRGRLAPRTMLLIALTVAITTVLNPGLDGSVVMSSLADCATMVTVGALGLMGIEIIRRLSDPDEPPPKEMAWRFGWVGALLVGLKQSNPVLLASIMAGLTLVALREPTVSRRRGLSILPQMGGPAIMVFGVWRWYVTMNVPGGEMAFRPFGSYNFEILPQMSASLWRVVNSRPIFHATMWLVTAVGLWAFFALPSRSNPSRRMAVVCATVWLIYNCFLLFVYLGAMTDLEAAMAADYWRYTPHVALLALYVPTLALIPRALERSLPFNSAWVAIAMAAATLNALLMRSDHLNPPGRRWAHFLRTTATEISRLVGPGSKVAIVPCWNTSPYAVIVRYHLWQLGEPERTIDGSIVWDRWKELAALAQAAARGEVDYVLVQDAECSAGDITTGLGMPSISNELALFSWQNTAWAKVGTWRVAPGATQ